MGQVGWVFGKLAHSVLVQNLPWMHTQYIFRYRILFLNSDLFSNSLLAIIFDEFRYFGYGYIVNRECFKSTVWIMNIFFHCRILRKISKECRIFHQNSVRILLKLKICKYLIILEENIGWNFVNISMKRFSYAVLSFNMLY